MPVTWVEILPFCLMHLVYAYDMLLSWFRIEVSSGDYGRHWIPILVKATALSSDSDSSGLDNDFSERNSSRNSGHAGEEYTIVPANSAQRRPEIGNGEVVVSLIPPKTDSRTSVATFEEESRVGKFWNQFSTLLKRSFLCVSRDMVRRDQITISIYIVSYKIVYIRIRFRISMYSNLILLHWCRC